jgi:hypothetical protein
MSAEKISYELKRFSGIKRDYTDAEVERLSLLLGQPVATSPGDAPGR